MDKVRPLVADSHSDFQSLRREIKDGINAAEIACRAAISDALKHLPLEVAGQLLDMHVDLAARFIISLATFFQSVNEMRNEVETLEHMLRAAHSGPRVN